jgi:hypothetical protein
MRQGWKWLVLLEKIAKDFTNVNFARFNRGRASEKKKED